MIFLNFEHLVIHPSIMTDQKETPSKYVTKVSIKLPDFWTEDPDLCFLHAEAAFRNSQITQSKTKFDHIVQKLPQKIMVYVLYKGYINAKMAYCPIINVTLYTCIWQKKMWKIASYLELENFW